MLTGLLGKTGVVVVCVCGERGGGDEAISKLKGAGSKHALPHSYLHFVLSTVACSLDCLTKLNSDGIFLILNAN